MTRDRGRRRDEEERQQRSRDGDHRVGDRANAADVRELVDDASRATGGLVGWGRIASCLAASERSLAQVLGLPAWPGANVPG